MIGLGQRQAQSGRVHSSASLSCYSCARLCAGDTGVTKTTPSPVLQGSQDSAPDNSAKQGVKAGVGKKHYTVVSNKTLCWAWGTQQ